MLKNRLIQQRHLKSDQASVRQEIEAILQANSSAPLGGLVGEKLINVLEVNLELRNWLID